MSNLKDKYSLYEFIRKTKYVRTYVRVNVAGEEGLHYYNNNNFLVCSPLFEESIKQSQRVLQGHIQFPLSSVSHIGYQSLSNHSTNV